MLGALGVFGWPSSRSLEKARLSASIEPRRGVVTRFAPSPTGFLHIGGARTALFNWLFARHHGGKFLLRIEDTDRARSTQPAIEAILDGMRWLGLDWDGDEVYPVRPRRPPCRGRAGAARQGPCLSLLMTPEELAAMRAEQQADRQPLRMPAPGAIATRRGPPDAPFVVRLKAAREGETVIEDRVQGPVTVQNAELDDLVLLRSDGTPTYMLAVVVDDHDMGVTHVIRGDDHLNNAFRQLGIISAMGWPEPVYAHVPLIHGADGAKLSKRHGALGVDAYRDELGILPEALSNYLLRLGWGHGDDEIISREHAIQWFDARGVGRSPARFDLKKLENFNGHYIREADDADWPRWRPANRPAATSADDMPVAAPRHAMLKPRAKNINELADGAAFLFRTRPIDMDEAAALLEGDARGTAGPRAPALSRRSTTGAQTRSKQRSARWRKRQASVSASWRSRCARRLPDGRPHRAFSMC